MNSQVKGFKKKSYGLLTLHFQCNKIDLGIERLKKLGSIDSATSSVPPVAPPWQRHNPFNLVDRENANLSNPKAIIKKHSFAEFNAKYDKEVIKARYMWKKNQEAAKNPPKEDVLVTF